MSAPAPSMYSPAAKAVAEKLGLKLGRANLEEFADTLLALAKADRNILAVTSDSRGSGKLGPFGQALPKQIVEVGIAEQNLVGIAAGLGSCGKNVFAVSPACFLTARSLEQIKNDICYSDHPVTVVGISAGVSYGALGTTHHSLHDFAVLRAINNITIVAPADNTEAREAVRAALPTLREFFSIAITFGLTVFAWIFFRALDVTHAFSYISEIFSASLFTIPHFPGIDRADSIVVLTIIFILIEWHGREQQFAIAHLGLSWKKPLRWAMYFGVLLTIYSFAGSEQQFIYFQF